MNSDFNQNNDDNLRFPQRVADPIHAFRKPVQTLRIDNICATIWRRQTRAGPMFTVTLGRLYQDKERNLVKTSSSYAFDELATLIRAANHVREVMADFATREGLDAITSAGIVNTGPGDERGTSPATAQADDAGDIDVPIVTAIDAEARLPDGRAHRDPYPKG